MHGKKVFIVDDEASIRDSLRLLLAERFEIATASDGAEALKTLSNYSPDVIVLDVMMPNIGGIETLRRLRELKITTPVLMLSASNAVKTAVEAMKLGAVDFVEKPFELETLIGVLEKAAAQKSPVEILTDKSEKTAEGAIRSTGEFICAEIVGAAPSMLELKSTITHIAPTDATVLINGESGTGKEMVARAIHGQSNRKAHPFVAINCAAIPETLIESELFGHEKGAFTHAVEQRIGLFEVANGGTLFLDEIGELSTHVQVKLLRFLQEREFYRVGSTKPINVNIRIIAATNKNLESLIQQKKFREDLFYRLNVVQIHLAPLRDRSEDIPLLVEHFVTKLGQQYGDKKLTFPEPVMRVLSEYLWPGNVRELENVVESLMALVESGEISIKDLPAKFSEPHRPVGEGASVEPGHLRTTLARDEIIRALKRANYLLPRAAELLGITRRTLRYQMEKLGISDMPPH